MIAGLARTQARAFAPASVGNVGVGFDILGHALEGVGDSVTVSAMALRAVRVKAIRGSAVELPMDAAHNTAGAALLALQVQLGLDFGFEIEIDKGIPFGSGMGGSAASAVAAVVAANALLEQPVGLNELYQSALEGELVASGSRHGDNVAPMLLGGLALAVEGAPPLSIPVPADLYYAHVHPHAVLETRRAREALSGTYQLGEFVAQSGRLALLLEGLRRADPLLIGAGLDDVLIEPRRAALIQGFAAVKKAALDAGALGAAISGAGPSVFAWCWGRVSADRTGAAMREAFAAAGLAADLLVGHVDAPAARVE